VFVCYNQGQLDGALHSLGAVGQAMVIEELLAGPEGSVFAVCDGAHAVPLPAAQDFKRAYDEDEGQNTGGMGSYSPVPDIDADELVERVHRPGLAELAQRREPFVAVLYARLILTGAGPKGLEVNARRG